MGGGAVSEWRVGTKVGRTLYRDDVLVGLMDTPELAAEVVAALSGQPCGHTHCGLLADAAGRMPLICTRPAGHPGAHADAWGAQWIATNLPGVKR